MTDRLEEAVEKQDRRMEAELGRLREAISKASSATVFYQAKRFVEQYERLDALLEAAEKKA
jgi:D-aminopeptidase